MARQEFTERVLACVREIPCGRVCTYGAVAALAGNPRAARQVTRLLYSLSGPENLPWHRVVGARGRILLPPERGGLTQRALLEAEGVAFDAKGRIDMERFGWTG